MTEEHYQHGFCDLRAEHDPKCDHPGYCHECPTHEVEEMFDDLRNARNFFGDNPLRMR
jgi:hypothetical protein